MRGKPQGRYAYPSPSRLIPARAGKTSPPSMRTRDETAHPRACGENAIVVAYNKSETGSSPRVRGKHRLQLVVALPPRLIPARAGKTRSRSRQRRSAPAHPRACGENFQAVWGVLGSWGSSPRVRGKPGRPFATGRPALAHPRACGENCSSLVGTYDGGAHPRACGENGEVVAGGGAAQGSSPRVRGKRQRRTTPSPGLGLIPARAGKTGCATPWRATRWAHPRACGENSRAPMESFFSWGSSPRVRGKPLGGFSSSSRGGLIPARAGKTTWGSFRVSARTAHPRACGENFSSHECSDRLCGSSPRVRGKQQIATIKSATGGLIPARAGKTGCSYGFRRRHRAHPRACGENKANSRTTQWGTGSSPRVRGKPRDDPQGCARGRLIPARAGKTKSPLGALLAPRAHPRACGENRAVSMRVDVRGGSSPRVRGKRRRAPPGPVVPGLIPARAGKTRHLIAGQRGELAHPRACGENLTPAGRFVIQGGSSPRVRGKPGPPSPPPVATGLIPARAGKTLVCRVRDL